MIFHVLDFLSMCVICWTSFVAAESAEEVHSWRRVLLMASLNGMMVSSFVGAVSVVMDPPALRWYVRGMIYFGMLFGVWFYQRRYGVLRHLRMLNDGIARRIVKARAVVNGRRVAR